jgi:uncharacterized damage-inducible protein DinB
MIPQTPWIERTFEFNYPIGMFPVIIERLRGTIPRLENVVHDVSDEALSRRQGTAWSIKEQAGHLYDLEELWMGRIEDFLSQKEVLRAADMTNEKTKLAVHNSKTIQHIEEDFKHARLKLIRIAEVFDESTALLKARHPRLKQTLHLIDSLFFVAEHDDHHLAKIRELVLLYKS